MIGREMASKSSNGAAMRYAFALLGGTMLAGVPQMALAQDGTLPETTAAAPQGDVIRSITINGSERLEAQTILSYIKLRVGQTYTQAVGDQALKDLYATELFASASVRNNGGDVVIDVVENPIINRIIMEGNKRLKDDKIYPEIKLAPRQIFTRSKVRADVARIIELYKRQGRFAASVEPKMVQLAQNRVD
ncbi:MAG: outer membrane protein assembly factor BamA, partial [Sphingomonadaceae bacterium]|nr:outer membrane protein assembly factor BamA [Sphingomonadaceae bacterium]